MNRTPTTASSMVLLHTIPGRCRLRVLRLGVDTLLQQSIKNCLGAQPQVLGFRFNLDCDSLTVQHSGSVTAIVALLRSRLQGPRRKNVEPPLAVVDAPARPVTAMSATGENGRHPAFAWASAAIGLAPIKALGPMAWFPLLACGIPIWKRALGTLVRERRLNVDFLDGLALAMALGRGQVGTGALMAWMVHLGDLIRDRTALRSRRRIRALLDFRCVTARKLEPDGSVCTVRADELQAGHRALLLAGDVVPADGSVESGIGAVDQSSITGESVPATRRRDDLVYAGSSVVEGRFTMRVTQSGKDTTAARIVQMLESAPVGETRMQNYAEKFADRLVAPLLGVNTALLALTGNVDRFMSMSIVDYGTGIRVAAPTSVLSSMIRAAHEGILIKSGVHVERLANLNGIAFDKTGTLTRGRLAILDVHAFTGALDIDRVLALAAAVEAPLRHPVARALVRHAMRVHHLTLPACHEVDFTIGLGVSGRVGEQLVRVGNERYMRQAGIAIGPASLYQELVERHGHTALLVAVDESLAGAFAYADELRPEAPAVVAALRKRSIRDIVMLTGDRCSIARQVARKLGINRFFAEVLPADKAQIIDSLRNGSGHFAMVGDGVNDSPALARADVGIALVEGADIARDAADVVLMEDGLFRIVDAIDISRSAMALVRQNYTLIAVCNTAALVLALPAGWVSPAAITLLSNGSAIAATLNAMRPLLNSSRQ
jgi:cation-transporting P-type ATPase C